MRKRTIRMQTRMTRTMMKRDAEEKAGTPDRGPGPRCRLPLRGRRISWTSSSPFAVVSGAWCSRITTSRSADSIEQAAGDSALIAIRSRASSHRPFTKINEIEEKAENNIIDRIKTLNEKVEDLRQKNGHAETE